MKYLAQSSSQRKRLVWLAFSLSAVCLVAGPQLAAQSTVDLERESGTNEASASESLEVRELIAEMSAAQFAERQRAYERLVTKGGDAVIGLERAAKSDDQDVAERCIRALVEIAANHQPEIESKLSDTSGPAGEALHRLALAVAPPLSKLVTGELERLKLSREDRAVEALLAAGVRVYRGRTGIVSSLSLSANDQIKWIQFFPKLRYVSLSGARVTDDGLRAVARIKSLSSLYLNQTSVSDTGMALLAELPELRSLSYSGSHVTPDGLRSLAACSSLQTLTMRDVLDLEQLRAAADLAQLHSLSLSFETIDQSAVQILNGMDFDRLSLSFSGIGDQQCEWISRIQIPIRLEVLRPQEMSERGWESLSKLKLTEFKVTEGIDDSGLAKFSGQADIVSLRISSAPITDGGLKQLIGLTSLRYASFYQTDVTQEGADEWKATLPNLRSVRVTSRVVRPPVPARPAFRIAGLPGQPTGAHVFGELTDEVVDQLKQAKFDLLFLGRRGLTSAEVKRAAKLPMQSLMLRCEDLKKDAIEAFQNHGKLQSLNVTSAAIGDDFVDALAGIGSLQELYVAGATQLTDTGVQTLIKRLATTKKLRRLGFADCTNLSDQALVGLDKLTELEALTIHGGWIGIDAIAVCRSSPKFQSISYASSQVTAAELAALQDLKLQVLMLSSTGITDDGVEVIARQWPQLTTLSLHSTEVTDEAMKSIAKLQSLESLTITDTQIGDVGLGRLATLQHLKTVTASKNHVSQEAFELFQQHHPDAQLRLR